MSGSSTTRKLNLYFVEKEVPLAKIVQIIRYFPFDTVAMNFSHTEEDGILYTLKGEVSEEFFQMVEQALPKPKKKKRNRRKS